MYICVYMIIYDHREGTGNSVHFYIGGGDDVVIDSDDDYNDLLHLLSCKVS